jgi:hypothetical protein
MGYKLLGYVVWNGRKWFRRRRNPRRGLKLALAIGAGLAVAGVAAAVVAQRRLRRGQDERPDARARAGADLPADSAGPS